MREGATPPSEIVAAFTKQITWCRELGSPFTAAVLGCVLAEYENGGPAADIVAGWHGDPQRDALPLRIAGALHDLVLAGQQSRLAACYPPHAVTDGGLRVAVRDTLSTMARFIRDFIVSPPQTNEVGRSGVLVGGFLEIAHQFGLPLRLLEIGASAGLNLLWDRYRYELGPSAWGDPASPLALRPDWSGPAPRTDANVRIADRRACDIAPVRIDDPEQRRRLRAYVWADQRERLARLDTAVSIALAAGHGVDQADAAAWVEARLGETSDGSTTVLYHSIMWQYLPAATQTAITTVVERAGVLATAARPLAWLSFEPPRSDATPELRLRVWPGSTDRLLATAQAHGAAVMWHG